MADTTTRFRKAFKYQMEEDDLSDGSHDGMDEQEQEQLLTTLRQKEASQNALYTKIFTVLPLILVVPYIYSTFAYPAATSLLSLLGITSLIASAYMMSFMPLNQPSSLSGGIDAASTNSNNVAGSSRRNKFAQRSLKPSAAFASHIPISVPSRLSNFLPQANENGPIHTYLPLLNGAICLVLALASYAVKGRTSIGDGFWILLLVPGVVLIMVSIVRQSIGDIQGGLKELDGLRYDYKGA